MKIATQPVVAPGARPVVHSKATGASIEEVQATGPVEQSLTCKNTSMNDIWSEQFAHFEAVFSRGNVFSMPKTVVQPVSSHPLLSDKPFISPCA